MATRRPFLFPVVHLNAKCMLSVLRSMLARRPASQALSVLATILASLLFPEMISDSVFVVSFPVFLNKLTHFEIFSQIGLMSNLYFT